MSDIKIDKNIPIPPSSYSKGRPTKYPFSGMNVGDSIALPMPAGKRLKMAAQGYSLRKGWKFTARKTIENGEPHLRVWRTE